MIHSILCLGVNHRTASVEQREHYNVRNTRLATLLSELTGRPDVEEAVVVATCNRVEYYLAVTAATAATTAAELRRWLEQNAGAPSPDPALYCLSDHHAVGHLYRVAGGLDSMVIGETEILGQIKRAYQAATGHGSAGRTLHRLFQHALNAAKALRSTTGIARGNVSVGSVAVELAETTVGPLRSKRVMILGAGETSSLTARALCTRGVESVIVSNRSFDRAEALARELNAEAIHFDQWPERFGATDIIITSTSAPRAVITCERLAPVLHTRQGRPLLIIDLAVPRDVEPAVSHLPGIHLCDIDSLQTLASEGLERRRREIAACEPILAQQVERFMQWMTKRP